MGGLVGSLACRGWWRQALAFGLDPNSVPVPGSPDSASQRCTNNFSGATLNSPIWAAAHYTGEGEY